MWPVAALAAAAVPLIGKWETRPRPPAVEPSGDGGLGVWPLASAGVVAVVAVVVVWVWRRRGRGAAGMPAGAGPARRWHCILYVDGVVVRRGYVVFPAADHVEMQAELERRFVERYGAGLAASARVHAKAVPADAARV